MQINSYVSLHEHDKDKTLELVDNIHALEGSAMLQATSTYSVSKSTAKAAQPPTFHGTLKDHGQPARLWVFGFAHYLNACNETRPVPFVTSYLRDDALAWWQSFGMQKLSAAATLTEFTEVFLEKYVKPSDSIEARAELQKLSQAKQSVEAYAAEFVQIRSRISIGTVVDSSTQARWFLEGLKNNVKKVLTNTATVTVLNDIEQLMPAAIDAETKLSLTVSQDATHGPTRTAAVRNGTRGGGRNGNRGRSTYPYRPPGRGRSNGHNFGPRPQQLHSAVNSSSTAPLRAVPDCNGNVNRTFFCTTCNHPGHHAGNKCPRAVHKQVRLNADSSPVMPDSASARPSSANAVQSGLLQFKSAQTAFNGMRILTPAVNLNTVQKRLKSHLPLKRTQAGITKPEAPAYVCATSAPDLDTIVHGLIAVKSKGAQDKQHPVRFLIDTGATESCISQSFVAKIGAHIKSRPETLSMANGSTAVSKGTVSLPINLQDYWDDAVFKVLPMNSNFDVILGRDWCNNVHCDIMYSVGVAKFQSQSTGKFHEIVLQPVSHGTLCPIISSVDFDKHIQADDIIYTCHVTAQDTNLDSNHDKVQIILDQYKDVFPDELPAEIPPERSIYHTIPLKDNNAVPPARKQYRLSQPELEECKQQVTALLAKGHIQPSCSPYGSPVLFVKKATGGLRMCIDFRGLNEQTVKNRYPLPRIDELFDKLQGATVFSSIDLQSAYNQVRLKPEDVPKTAFTTPFGLFEFKVLCFGLTNAPGTFQNIMNDVLRDVIGKFVLVYLDDIVIFSKNEDEHMMHLKIVLELLRRHKLYAKLSKCTFVKSELKFLGHIISAKGIQVDPAKVSIVKDWPVPQSKHDMQKFLGLANYFCKFIMGYAQLVAPLQKLTKNKKDYT